MYGMPIFAVSRSWKPRAFYSGVNLIFQQQSDQSRKFWLVASFR